MATLPYDAAWLTRNGYDLALAGRDDRDPVWLAAVAERRAARKAAPQRPATLTPATDANEPRGLGDSVANAIKRATFGLVKECGGCAERRRKLNERFPYRKPPPSP